MAKLIPTSESNSPLTSGLTEVKQKTVKLALDQQAEQLDFAVLSALNQRRQVALAALPNRSSRWWRWFNLNKMAIPSAVALSAAALALTFILRTAGPAVTDADAALLADFDSANVASVESALPDDLILNLNDEELALMSEFEFYAWLDQQLDLQKGI